MSRPSEISCFAETREVKLCYLSEETKDPSAFLQKEFEKVAWPAALYSAVLRSSIVTC